MIVQWIAIAVIVLVALLVIKLEHHAKAVKMFIIVVLGALFYFSIMGIFSSDQVDITSPKGMVSAVYLYVGWVGETASSLWHIGTDTVTLVGNAIKINNTETGSK